MSVSAHYYDGRSARRHAVTLTLEGDVVRVRGDGIDRIGTLHELRISEPMGEAPRLITFPDAAFCEVRDHASLRALLEQSGHRDSFIVRWQSSLGWIAASALLCAAFFAAGYVWGLPWLAKSLAEEVPDKVMQAISEQTLATLDQSLAEPSRLPAARQARIVRRFERMTPPEGRSVPHRVVFRASDVLRANALALPSGTIVVTDGLVNLAKDDEEVLGVLAHELGHVRARHGLRLMLQGSVAALVAAWYIGDVSSILAAAPVALLQASYSRDFEREADAYAAAMLRANHIAPTKLAELLERMEAARRKRDPAAADTGGLPDYLSGHPATAERLRALRQSASRSVR